MKKAAIVIVIALGVAMLAALVGCGGGGSDSAVVRGRVAVVNPVTGNQDALAGVTVSVASSPSVSTTTGPDGVYQLGGVPIGTEVVINYKRAGYADSEVVLTCGCKKAQRNLVMVPLGKTQTITTSVANTVTHDGLGASVSFAPNSIVDAAGAPVAAAVVTIAASNPDVTGHDEAMPGVVKGGMNAETGLQGLKSFKSFGAINVTLRDAAGKELKLATGQTATVVFPIPGSDPSLAQIDLFSLNPTTGQWVKDGVATRQGGTYRAQVSHFSWWSINVSPKTIKFVVIKVVEDPTTMVPVCGANVTLKADRGYWLARGITSTQGLVVFEMDNLRPDQFEVDAIMAYYERMGIVASQTWVGTDTIKYVFWLRPSNTGAPGGCPDC